MLIKRRKNTGLKIFNNFKAFIECTNDIDDIYKNMEEYNPNNKHKMLTVFNDMITDMFSNKRLY